MLSSQILLVFTNIFFFAFCSENLSIISLKLRLAVTQFSIDHVPRGSKFVGLKLIVIYF